MVFLTGKVYQRLQSNISDTLLNDWICNPITLLCSTFNYFSFFLLNIYCYYSKKKERKKKGFKLHLGMLQMYKVIPGHAPGSQKNCKTCKITNEIWLDNFLTSMFWMWSTKFEGKENSFKEFQTLFWRKCFLLLHVSKCECSNANSQWLDFKLHIAQHVIYLHDVQVFASEIRNLIIMW